MSTTSALGFLLWRTTRNRVARQLSRLKQPRYAIALLIGIGYLVLVFANPGGPGRAAPESRGVPAIAGVAALGLAITVCLWWLRGGVGSSLAFLPAEVQYLFPAPLSRRALIGYRIVRAQILILFNALLWMLLIRSWGIAIPWPMRFLTAWGFFSLVGLHRLGSALVQTVPLTGARRAVLTVARVVSVAVLVALVAGLAPPLLRFGEVGAREGFSLLGAALVAPPAGIALMPFRFIIAPLHAAGVAAWAGNFALVLAAVALHVIWVLSMRVAFEETAATATSELAAKLAAFRERRAGGSASLPPRRAGRNWIPLKPQGWPAAAIVWKNTIALIRIGSLKAIVFMAVIVLVGSRLIASLSSEKEAAAAAAPFIAIAVMAFVLGPRLVRNDLRQDLLSLSLLKSYPLKGSHIVAAEMVSPTVVLSLFQVAMLLGAWFSVPGPQRQELAGGSVRAMAVALPFALVAMNGMNVAIQNGMALMFPSWIRLGADSGGIEAVGQNLLAMIGALLSLLVALIAPVGAAVVAGVLSRPALGGGALALAAAAGTVVMAAELAGMIALLGRVFEKTEPTALA